MCKLVLVAALASISFCSLAQTTYNMCSSNNWNGSSAWITSACGSGNTTIPNCSSSCTTNASVTNATATVNGNFGVNNLTLSQNGNLVVSAGQILTIYGDLILSTNTGTITIDGGTLIVKGNVIVIGDENGVTIQDNGANKGSFQVTGNITACSDGTVTCSSPTAHTFNVNLNGTKSPNISVGGSVWTCPALLLMLTGLEKFQ